jgi:hypothetical protein
MAVRGRTSLMSPSETERRRINLEWAIAYPLPPEHGEIQILRNVVKYLA